MNLVKKYIAKNHEYVFYMHPWELDYRQPDVRSISKFNHLRHYYGLKKNYLKFSAFIEGFLTTKDFSYESLVNLNFD
jgi:hypothetical protein